MEGEPSSLESTKRARQETDFTLCIKCQKSDSSRLVIDPSLEVYSKFLSFVHKLGQYGAGDFPAISCRLDRITDAELKAKKASWHRTCYSETCHTGHLEHARIHYEKACEQRESHNLKKRCGRPSSMESSPSVQISSQAGTVNTRFTRSVTNPFNKCLCFFCQENTHGQDIHEVSTFNAGDQLRKAVEVSNNEQWKVQLGAAISANDARAIDVKYHLACWVKHVQRASKKGSEATAHFQAHTAEETNIGIIASDIEFICLVKGLLRDGSVLSMAELRVTYNSILQKNGVDNLQLERGIKEKLSLHIDNIHFMRPKRRNESECVFSTAVRDAAMEDAMTQNVEGNIRQLFKSASILRKTIENQARHPWVFDGALNIGDAEKHVPSALYSFIRWVLQGPTQSLQTEARSATVHQDVLTISQNIMLSYKSNRQVMYKPKHPDSPFHHRLEWPQLLAVGIAIHQSIRSKKLLQFLHGFGLSVDYSRILRLETQLATSVIEDTQAQGAYLPSTMHKGRFIFFAVDNSDFNEDMPDGKRTLHATATALYQRQGHIEDSQRNTRNLRLYGKTRDRSLKSVTIPVFVPCHTPSTQSIKGPTFASFEVGSIKDVIKPFEAQDTVWLLSRTIMRTPEVDDIPDIDLTSQEEPDHQLQPDRSQSHEIDNSVTQGTTRLGIPPGNKITKHNIPTWTAYNSLLASDKPLTKVAALPLVAAPAHEWQTLLTVLKQTQQINCIVMGPDRKTVITLDMALYERAKQLEMSRDDCKGKWVLRLGEMHTVMAALRAAGNTIEDSGLDEAWNEADIYGPTTTRQILEAKHMKRALEAHMTTVQALYDLYVEEFFIEYPQMRGPCAISAEQIDKSCGQCIQQEICKEQQHMLATLKSNKVLDAMAQFDQMKEARSPLFKFVRRYMRMVLLIYTFIRATREGLWELHLASLDKLCKYFFAHDKQKYARLVPLYLAEMTALQTTDPDIYEEFMAGNFAVNKNQIPFCAIGADHALEHINHIMKVTGGLVGITQNASARERFFLTAPELGRLAEEAHQMAGSPTAIRKTHHELSTVVWTRQEENILKLKSVIRSSTNPMTYEEEDLVNIITKVIMPTQVQKDVCNQDEIGHQKYTTFVGERINSDEVGIWARMKKVQLKMWKSARKPVKHRLAEQVVEMKDDRALFARMLIVARSRPEINLKEAIGQHEFTSLPRALFGVTGALLPCTDKSKFMAILEELPKQKTVVDIQQPENIQSDDIPLPPKKVTVIDDMAVVQAMGKPAWIGTCAEWADHFNTTLESKTKGYDEVHLVFDRYDVSTSLKEATRERRQGGKPATAYHVEDKTPIGKVSAQQFLSCTSTKDELTVYLSQKAFHHFEREAKTFIVNSRQDVFSNNVDVQHLRSSQEEADTRIILHSLDAVRRGATKLYIQSPDTDVLVLMIRRYHQLCKDTYFITGVGNKRREIPLEPIVHALGSAKAAALPGFHAFTGADQTGRFAGKGKLTCWKTLVKCSAEIISAFAALGASRNLTARTEESIEAYVCQLYEPSATITNVGDLRWKLFTKKQLEGQRLPPTRGALKEAIARAHYQAMAWYQDNVPEPQMPPATEYGWKAEGDRLVAIPTKDPPAPSALTYLIKCGCKKNNCQSHCSCRSENLNCSEMCMCGADEEICSNVGQNVIGIDDEDEDDSDPLV